MSLVLTTASSVPCAHEGKVQVSSNAKLKVAGQSVLVKSSVQGKTISGCKNLPPPQTNVPCTSCDMITAGESTKLRVRVDGGFSFVLLKSLTGQTNGKIGGAFQFLGTADAKQSKLKSV